MTERAAAGIGVSDGFLNAPFPPNELRDNLPHVMELMERKIQQVVNDLHAIIARMLPFEQKYELLSADFYTLYQSGQLDTGENLRDVTLWAGAYEMKLKLEEAARRKFSHG